jgi:HK97 family phage major capsid protein
MNTFTRRHWPLLAVVAMLLVGAALAHGGYIDSTYLTAAPLVFPIGNIITDVPVAKLLRAAQGKREEGIKAMEAIVALVPDGGVMTDEQKKLYDGHMASIKGLDTDIGRFKALVEAQRGSVEIGKILGTKPNIEDDPKRGFKSLGEFAGSVYHATKRGARVEDERLLIGAGAATFGNENTGMDGGYAVPTEFATEIAKLSLAPDNFLTRTDQVPVTGNSITFPSDETTPWGTDGIRAYWAAEAAAANATKPKIKPNSMRLNKLFGLVPVTDELIQDWQALGAFVTNGLGRSIKWKSNDALVNGLGAGMPLGVLQSGALVVVAIEGGQATGTLVPLNVAKMYAAMPADYLGEAEWVMAPDLIPQLMTLNTGNQLLWTPPQAGFAQAPGGFLLGRPITFSQTNAAKGAQGDILFVNWKAYRTISKDGVQIAQSMHLYFDSDETAFRATFRLDGQPTFKNQIVQARGAQNLSPYVTLAARP